MTLVRQDRRNFDVSVEEFEDAVREAKKHGLDDQFVKSEVLRVLVKAARKNRLEEKKESMTGGENPPEGPTPPVAHAPLAQTQNNPEISPVEIPTTGQASLRVFIPETWQQDYQERKLEFLLQNLALEERKQTFRERAFDALLDFKKDALKFQRERYRLPPVIDVRGSTKWKDADEQRVYREHDGWKNVE